ncbi:hypothetical protein [Flavobacterium sp. KBS0721]|uniref:hypothetical protein n=1 Tax=Flavobacterium sp. KBS0721 TaxID=1179672 RepID=UPI00098FC4B4|nr:hypothetical protein [Flavobacterium sp. KBS0721]QDW22712.1 hypothetical protein B0M43_0022180 [Flavobacterium sp. KBS0721]
MKKIITLFLVAFLFINCSSNDNDKVKNPVEGIWKLVKTESLVFGGPNNITDFSDQNIIYRFDNKSNLTIIKNGTNVSTQKYEYKLDYISGSNTPGETKVNVVVIDGSTKYIYHFINGQMKLEQSYVDGEDLYFEKL